MCFFSTIFFLYFTCYLNAETDFGVNMQFLRAYDMHFVGVHIICILAYI